MMLAQVRVQEAGRSVLEFFLRMVVGLKEFFLRVVVGLKEKVKVKVKVKAFRV
jgi:hypothetical protein